MIIEAMWMLGGRSQRSIQSCRLGLPIEMRDAFIHVFLAGRGSTPDEGK